MFKSLIATCLMTFSCSGNSATLHPQRALVGNNQVYGSYCFNEHITGVKLDSIFPSGEELVSYSFGSDFEEYSIYAFTYNSEALYEYYYELADNFNFYVAFDGELYSINVQYTGTDSDYDNPDYSFFFQYYSGSNEETIHLESASTSYQQFNVYFEEYFYLSEPYNSLFNLIFARTNTYNFVYTGYYTFGNLLSFERMNLYGTMNANNNLYNNMNISNNDIYFTYSNKTSHVFDHSYLYDSFNHKWSGSKSIYLTGVLINTYTQSVMNNNGVFEYVRDTNISDFEDLFFSIADTPIYYITSFFSVELFGIELYLAFMSLVTLLVIVFIAKKLI